MPTLCFLEQYSEYYWECKQPSGQQAAYWQHACGPVDHAMVSSLEPLSVMLAAWSSPRGKCVTKHQRRWYKVPSISRRLESRGAICKKKKKKRGAAKKRAVKSISIKKYLFSCPVASRCAVTTLQGGRVERIRAAQLAAYLKPEQHLQAQTVFSQESRIRIFSVDDNSGISNWKVHIGSSFNSWTKQFLPWHL